jgi:hypothetical protein
MTIFDFFLVLLKFHLSGNNAFLSEITHWKGVLIRKIKIDLWTNNYKIDFLLFLIKIPFQCVIPLRNALYPD